MAAKSADWISAYLRAAGYPDTPKNRQFLTSWQRWEGGHTNNSATWNYLNTTQDMSGNPTINSVGVRAYRSLGEGAQAFAKTLKNGKYIGLDQALAQGDPYTKNAIPGLSVWLSGKVDPHGVAYASRVLGTHTAADRLPAVHSDAFAAPTPSGPGTDSAHLFGQIATGAIKPTDALQQVADAAQSASRAFPTTPIPQPPLDALQSKGNWQKFVKLSPTADRAGVPTSERVLNFVGTLGERFGSPLEIGTGSNHKRITQDGFVSDHWDGNAADVPASGQQLLRLGFLALVQAGMSQAEAKRAAAKGGGLFNVGGYQIIFGNYPGHSNHLHVGVRG